MLQEQIKKALEGKLLGKEITLDEFSERVVDIFVDYDCFYDPSLYWIWPERQAEFLKIEEIDFKFATKSDSYNAYIYHFEYNVVDNSKIVVREITWFGEFEDEVESEGQKEILGRLVEWSYKDKKILIHLNDEDRTRMERQKKELGFIDYAENDKISAEYFKNDDFLKIHDEVVFLSTLSEQGTWDDEDRSSYLEIRVLHPADIYDY